MCKNLIYPVPDPRFPFLGVHFTRTIDGRVECGPNAVLAFAREGYRLRDANLAEMFESLTYPGSLRLFARYWRMGLGEMWRSVSKTAFVRALQRLLPAIHSEHLEPAPAGVRAGRLARRQDGGRFSDLRVPASRQRLQRTLAGGHLVAGNRQDDCPAAEPPDSDP